MIGSKDEKERQVYKRGRHLLCIPQIPEAIYYLRHVATTKSEDPTLKYF